VESLIYEPKPNSMDISQHSVIRDWETGAEPRSYTLKKQPYT